MKTRIFKNYFTTILGVCLVAATIILVYKKIATLPEAGLFISIAGGLILSKDPFSKKDNTITPTDNNPKPNNGGI